mgnify:CR=1 FL=1
MKWVGTKWEETIAFVHEDNELGSVAREPGLLERAREVGRRLGKSPPLEPASAPGALVARSIAGTRRRAPR